MDNFEALFWVAMLKQANKGDEEAQESLRGVNEKRKAKGLPTIQEELRKLAEE